MKLDEKVTAFGIGAILMILFVMLLVCGRIGQGIFATLATITLVACVGISTLSRLKEFNLREMKLILDKIEKTKAEIEEMYGGIEHLQRERINPDEALYNDLGLYCDASLTFCGSVVNYVMGCMKRERERVARIFINEKSPEQRAAAILDASLDKKVFKWVGPGALLDDPAPQRPVETNA